MEMSTSPVPQANKPPKIPREMSNLVVKLVLERSDDLIRNSYRRLTTENVARNEHWQKIAEMVASHFGQPVDPDRIKQHFHNRKKVLIARIKEEMRTFQPGLTTLEKLEELVRRRVLAGENDEQLARICLEMEDEERKGTEPDFPNGYNNVFGDSNHTSLLSQLLSSATLPDCNASVAGSSRESEQPSNHAPILSKLLSQASREGPIFGHNNNNNNNNYLSHLIVDVTSPGELKRLLSVLIDHGFSRFSHVDSLSQIASTFPRFNGSLTNGHSSHHLDGFFDKDEELLWNGVNGTQSNEDFVNGELDMQSIADRVEQVGVDVKTEAEADDQEALLADVQQKSMALFERKSPEITILPPAKRSRSSVDAPTVPCELCGSVIRLNTGGSKWNLFEHVVLKHSDHRPFRCSQCPYEAARKIRIRQHASSLHGSDAEPVDNVTPEIRKEWSETMARCFPSHQYGKHINDG